MKTAIIGLASGVLGIVVALVGFHLYQDHLLVDAIRADVMKRQVGAPKGVGP